MWHNLKLTTLGRRIVNKLYQTYNADIQLYYKQMLNNVKTYTKYKRKNSDAYSYLLLPKKTNPDGAGGLGCSMPG